MATSEAAKTTSKPEIFQGRFRSAVTLALNSKFPEISVLKPKQEEALFGFLQRKDVFAVLPTGCGKSLIFQLVPDVCSLLQLQGLDYPKNAILIVICPLNALVDSHINELCERGISACSLTEGNFSEDDLKAGKYSIVLTNPESLVLNNKWRTLLKSEVYQQNLFGLVADEAHVVPKW